MSNYLGIDLGPLIIDDDYSERTPEMTSSFLVSLYTVYGLLFHMGNLLKNSDVDDEEDDDLSLSAVYNTKLEEESSEGSLYEGSAEEEEVEEEDDEDGDGDNDDDKPNSKAQAGKENSHGEPEESTRGKKRKHEDEDEN
ncbi:unnamed protein product [Pieris macdunnoughi]|uniref:Uncharacterized protein n=1 Tax=Pieris macdunnoughi TaxID=345717 RepID=A0A821PUI7_9NEOP|nr:unnamed protein product [Pieris macdunnoughi]